MSMLNNDWLSLCQKLQSHKLNDIYKISSPIGSTLVLVFRPLKLHAPLTVTQFLWQLLSRQANHSPLSFQPAHYHAITSWKTASEQRSLQVLQRAFGHHIFYTSHFYRFPLWLYIISGTQRLVPLPHLLLRRVWQVLKMLLLAKNPHFFSYVFKITSPLSQQWHFCIKKAVSSQSSHWSRACVHKHLDRHLEPDAICQRHSF